MAKILIRPQTSRLADWQKLLTRLSEAYPEASIEVDNVRNDQLILQTMKPWDGNDTELFKQLATDALLGNWWHPKREEQ
jgi:hypothetical protein